MFPIKGGWLTRSFSIWLGSLRRLLRSAGLPDGASRCRNDPVNVERICQLLEARWRLGERAAETIFGSQKLGAHEIDFFAPQPNPTSCNAFVTVIAFPSQLHLVLRYYRRRRSDSNKCGPGEL
jgi:hypothetical protein